MSIRQKLANIISRRLCPQAHADAERYERLLHDLDEARWWLGSEFPEAASLAHRILDKEHWYLTAQLPKRDPAWKWQAPEWALSIHEFREWLRRKPFADQPPVSVPAVREGR